MPGEPLFLTEKPGRPQSAGSRRVRHYRGDRAHRDARPFLPAATLVIVECEGGTAAWLAGTLAALSVQGHKLPLPQEHGPIKSLISSLLWQAVRSPLRPFSVAPPIQAQRALSCLGPFSSSACQEHGGVPLAGLLLCTSGHPALTGAPWLGSCSVVQSVRCLMGQALYCSAAAEGT